MLIVLCWYRFPVVNTQWFPGLTCCCTPPLPSSCPPSIHPLVFPHCPVWITGPHHPPTTTTTHTHTASSYKRYRPTHNYTLTIFTCHQCSTNQCLSVCFYESGNSSHTWWTEAEESWDRRWKRGSRDGREAPGPLPPCQGLRGDPR